MAIQALQQQAQQAPAGGRPVAPLAPVGAAPALGFAQATIGVRAPWGSGAGQVGHVRGIEGNPEGPMSFDVAADGRIAVLDQVNARVVVWQAGAVVGSFAVARTAQDLCFAGPGFAVLDRLGARSASVLDGIGRTLATVPLDASGSPLLGEPGGVTALEARPDGLWLEVGHEQSWRIARLDGSTSTAAEVSGRPGRAVGWVQAGRAGPRSVFVRSGGVGAAPAREWNVVFSLDVRAIRAAEQDAHGRTIVAAWLTERDAADPDRVVRDELHAVALDAAGREVARGVLDRTPEAVEETFRSVRVDAQGGVWTLAARAAGLEVTRFAP